MNILGIGNAADSGVALFQDGRLVLAVNEERLSRTKLDGGYPHRSLTWVLNQAKLTPNDVDLVCYGFTNGMPSGDFSAALEERVVEYGSDPKTIAVIRNRLDKEREVDSAQLASFDRDTIHRLGTRPQYRCHHHEAHRAAAYMSSPFREALVVTCDGRGDCKSFTVSAVTPKGVEERTCGFSWESIGYFYGRITQLCGFVPNRHEGKITGLAGHGDPKRAMALMEKMITVENGRFKSFPGDYYVPFFTNYSDVLLQEAGGFSREDLAAAAQAHLERCVCQVIAHHLRATGLRQICLAGGVFSNVKLNQRIRELAGVDGVFVYPNMGDGGICAGSVYDYLLREKGVLSSPLETLYLGPDLDAEALATLLGPHGCEISRPADLVAAATDRMRQYKSVGLVQGRCEFGPRALGNRSIVGFCDDVAFCDSINERLHRSEFMPFAPVTTAELASRCFAGYRADHFSAQHMTMTYNVTPEFAKNAPAVVHVDGTARPQVVTREGNPVLHALITRAHQQYGALCLLNTSFNLHEEPILGSAEDVAATFLRGAVDYLLAPPYLITAPLHKQAR